MAFKMTPAIAAAIGGVGGAGLGAMSDSDNRLRGALVGGTLGTGAGFGAHKLLTPGVAEKVTKTTRKAKAGSKLPRSGAKPAAAKPVAEKPAKPAIQKVIEKVKAKGKPSVKDIVKPAPSMRSSRAVDISAKGTPVGKPESRLPRSRKPAPKGIVFKNVPKGQRNVGHNFSTEKKRFPKNPNLGRFGIPKKQGMSDRYGRPLNPNARG